MRARLRVHRLRSLRQVPGALVVTAIGYADLLRDIRHESARAASDLADWLAYLTVDGKASRTLYSYTRELSLLLREFPEHELGDFTAGDITSTLALKPERSRYITRSIFNAFFQWAEDQELIERNPMRGKVPRMKQPRRRPTDIFSEAEVALMAADPLLCLMLYTGLRRGECIALKRSSVSLQRARLVVYAGKGDKDRIVPLPLEAMQAVNELDLTYQLQGDEYVWSVIRRNQTTWWRRKPVGSTTFEGWYRQALEAAGVRYLNPHQCRHTYAEMTRRLYDIEERQLLMGHEKIATTQAYYGHLTIEDVARKMAEVGI